jgi:hypothetical protein
MTRKLTTPEKKLLQLIKKNDAILNWLLIERIEKVMEMTITDINENPSNWERNLIHPSLLIRLNENVNTILK